MGETPPSGVRRRRLLAGVAAGSTALTTGCIGRLRSLAGWGTPGQVQLRIKTLPSDADPYALPLARTVADWFGTAGIDAGVVPMAEEELVRETLLGHEFDMFVMRLPALFRNPDALYTLLHSRFAAARAWQNPFGFADLDVDELLVTQRQATSRRRRAVLSELQTTLPRMQPFTLLTVPDDVRAAGATPYGNWNAVDLGTSLGYLGLERTGGEEEADEATLRVATTDPRPTTNLNPLAVEFRRNGLVTGLLYDPLGYPVDGEPRPWLATSWAFVEESPPVARVDIRPDATWHDGEALTASDVAFTYELLADTTLANTSVANTSVTDDETEADAPIPSPRFHDRSSLVDEVRVLDDASVEVAFIDAAPSVAARAFTVPILPEHVWGERNGSPGLGGVEFGPVTEALVTNNVPPVGSGPLRFVRNTPREQLVLERFDDHFLNREGEPPSGELPGRVGPVAFQQLSIRVVGSDVSGIEMVASGEADLTATPVSADTVPRIGRSDELDLLVEQSATPYVLGYNVRRPHLNNPRVRETLARLIDGEYLAESVLDGYGRPAVGPLWGTEWYPEELEWTDENPVTPFLGSDGDVDVPRAREAFREVGYRYDEGRLIGGGG